MMNVNIEEMERRYHLLARDFQHGQIDETTFMAEIDKLQFQDEWGRYWMLGAQSGAWHYYDNQTWQPANPRESDKLPFVDDQGRYWQRGEKSGAWYYYDPQSSEWVNPQQLAEAPPPAAPAGVNGELFQDDEGRYWALGDETGLWYFFDHSGWHPAHEFQGGAYPAPASTPPYQAYSVEAPAYNIPQPQPNFGGHQPPPVQVYVMPPHQEPSYFAPGGAPPSAEPSPSPRRRSKTGTWYFHDGDQWLKYTTDDEEADTEAPPPPPPKKNKIETAAVNKPSIPDEPVIAEIHHAEGGPKPEVVDVEVITIIEPDEPMFRPSMTKEEVTPPPPPPQPVYSSPPPAPAPMPQEQTQPFIPKTPRVQEPTQGPKIIIPTGEAARDMPPPRARTASRPSAPVSPRRPYDGPPPEAAPRTPPQKRGVTQPMPQAAAAPPPAARVAHSDTAPVPVAQPAPLPVPAAAPPPAAQPPQPEKTGYTLGDVLRAFPSTVWTAVGGIVVLFLLAVIIIGVGAWLRNNDLSLSSLLAAQDPTPTLAAGPPNLTPTPGPSPTSALAAQITITPPTMEQLSSPSLGVTLAYPKDWQKKEGKSELIFSPSEKGLDPEKLQDVSFWVGTDDSSVPDLMETILAKFPSDVETVNKGTISIASQDWSSAQIKFKDENLGGEGTANLAVTRKDEVSYYVVAVSPIGQWSVIRPVFQEMVNSLEFSEQTTIAQAPTEPASKTRQATTPAPDEEGEATATAEDATADEEPTPTPTPKATLTPTPKATPTPKPTPTPTGTPAPVFYTIQAGDSLQKIANEFGVDVDLLAEMNGIDDPSGLQIGEELLIPFTPEEWAAWNKKNNPQPVAEAEEDESPTPRPTTPAKEATEDDGESSPAPTSPANGTATDEKEVAAPQPTPTPTPEEAEAPASTLSGRIAYPAFSSRQTYDLWIADLESGEQYVAAWEASQPAFNKSGSLLAYRSWIQDERGIFFTDFVGGRGGHVTTYVEDGLPVWLPDEFTFAFVTRREGDRIARVYVGDQSGKGDHSVGFTGEYVSAFPNSQLIVKGCLPSGDCGLFTLPSGGGSGNKILSGSGDTAPAVSPNGQKIAFMSANRDGATNWDIFVMDAGGGNIQHLTTGGGSEGLPTWSPDGNNIAYVSNEGGVWAVWAMNADGSSPRKLFNMKGSPDGSVLRAEDNSKGWLEERISWAP